MDGQRTERDRLRAKFVKTARMAETQRAPAVKLFCIECMGGSYRDAAACETRDCFLWPHAFKRQRQAAAQTAG